MIDSLIDLGVPKTWNEGYRGVMKCYTSPSGNQWICANYRGEYDWCMDGKYGTGEYVSDCINQMAKRGMLEGEFE